jgi:hypothetical protein
VVLSSLQGISSQVVSPDQQSLGMVPSGQFDSSRNQFDIHLEDTIRQSWSQDIINAKLRLIMLDVFLNEW